MQVGDKNSFSTNISLDRLLSTVRLSRVVNWVPSDRGKVVIYRR